MSFMLLTVSIWALSFIRLLVAGLLYWPLLVCHIRGNLKEYCCHKVDKRISQMLVERRRKRFDQKPEKRETSNSPDSGKYHPTLPKVELDDDGASVISMPLYPLSRTDTGDSRRGLLTRTDTASTNATQPYLYRSNTAESAASLRSATPNPYLTRTDTTSTSRQPTLPHLVGDFTIPPVPRPPPHSRPPRIDTAITPRLQGPTSARTAPVYGPPSARSDRFGPPPRSNTTQTMRGYGPPPRSNTFDVGVTPRRPERPYDAQGSGYVRRDYVPR